MFKLKDPLLLSRSRECSESLFSSALAWTTLEALTYQAIFFTHQLGLFFYLDPALYGLQGAFFASMYLSIALFNRSFDLALSPVFTDITRSKEEFLFWLKNSIKHLLFFIIGAVAILMTLYIIANEYQLVPVWMLQFTTSYYLFVATYFIFLEGLKKNLRAFLHLAFHNKLLARIEVLTILCYTTSTWLLHYVGVPFSFELFVFPFLITSTLTTSTLTLLMYSYYKELPTVSKQQNPSKTQQRFLYNANIIYGNQLTRLLFSSNFLLPFLAFKVGLANAGLAAFVNILTFTCTSVLQKIFGPVGTALFVYHQSSNEKQYSLLTIITRASHYVTFACLVIFAVNMQLFFFFKELSFTGQTLLLTYLFFLVHLSEGAFVVYEKYFNVKEKSHYLLFFNLTHGALSLVVARLLFYDSLILVLAMCLTFRLFGFIILAFLCARLKNTSHS